MIQKFFAENLATKAMALFLALLTWAYLFIQGNASDEIDLEFRPPELDKEVFASVVYRDANKDVLLPGDILRVRLSGPKGDVSALKVRAPKTYVCNVSLDPKKLDKDQDDTVRIDLREQAVFFGIPGSVKVEPIPAPTITLKYVKYHKRPVKLVVPAAAWIGEPAAGYEVESVKVSQEPIEVKIPADRSASVNEVAIGPVNVGGQDKPFVVERQELGPDAQEQNIRPLGKFIVSVNISQVKETRTMTVDVTVSAKPENHKRIDLGTGTIKVGVRGPKEAVEQVTPQDLVVYVLVTDKDMEPPGPKLINESAIGCHVDQKFRGKISVTIMPDDKPENRQVKITVREKAN